MNSELRAIRDQLKLILKQKKLNYAGLAKRLGVAEVTVKRFFTTEDISFLKLQQICQEIGISALDLMALVKNGNEEAFSLSVPQEEYFSKNEALYDFFVSLLKHRSLASVLKTGKFHKINVPKFLKELAKLDLIDLPLGDAVHVKKTGTLTWIKAGPLQKAFMRKRHISYLDAFEIPLKEESSYLSSSQRSLRSESLQEMKRDLEFIVHKYRSRAYREEKIYSEDQLVPVAWIIGAGEYTMGLK
jgi:DNA-binding Xre family transcriptional regulator